MINMKRFKKILRWTGLILLFIIAGLFITIYSRQHLTFEAPMPAIKASKDSAIIARGAYLVNGPAHCGNCHVPQEEQAQIKQGKILPLSGGYEFETPFGDLYSRNLTPDAATGLGAISDEQIARALRYGVGHDKRAVLPFMAYSNMSDEDLRAIISYLRSMPAVRKEIPPHKLNLLGNALMAFMIKPVGPDGTPPVAVQPDTTVAYGKYLANNIADCKGCHTNRDAAGNFAGPDMAGGNHMEEFITPNLTPDKATGVISNWSEKAFIARFRRGRFYDKTPMPWEHFGRMNDNDLKALYRYLRSLEPVNNKVEKTYVPEKKG